MAERRCQVAIVGGGPVGLALAVDLGLRGISCVLVEQRHDIHNIPKGQNLTQRTLEHFHFWGIADELRDARVIPADFPGNFIVAYGNLASEYWYVPASRENVDRYFYQRGDRLPQYLTERVLRKRLVDCAGVEAMFGWRADAVSDADDCVRVEITDGDRRQTLLADYAVGCDGNRSLVRAQLGLSQSGTDFDQPMVLAVFRSRELHDRLKRFPPAYIYRVVHKELRGYWRFFGRVDDRDHWFFHAPAPANPTEQDIRVLLHEAAGFDFSCSFDHIGSWNLRISVADDYRRRRVFLAGDAAHSHPPYGGFGLNSGLEDVVNLGWKLAAVLEGWGGETLLRSYAEERRPVIRETTEYFIEGRMHEDRVFFDCFDPERNPDEFTQAWKEHRAAGARRTMAYVPHYEGSPVIAGPAGGVCGAIGEHRLAARAGYHLAPLRLTSGVNVYEALGHGFALLAFDAEASAIAEFEHAARQLAIPLQIVRDGLNSNNRAYGARIVLVRPDQHVAWTGDTAPMDAAVLMSKVVGR